MNLEVIRYEWYPLGKTSTTIKSAICSPVEADIYISVKQKEGIDFNNNRTMA